MPKYRVYQRDTWGQWHATSLEDTKEQADEVVAWLDCPGKVVPE